MNQNIEVDIDLKIGFVGVGHMGSILARALSSAASDCAIYVADKKEQHVLDVIEDTSCLSANAEDICKTCDIVILGMRPQDQPDFLSSVKGIVAERINSKADFLFVTMAAGVPMASVQKNLDYKVPVMRIMPNTPVAVGAGAIPYCTSCVDGNRAAEAKVDFLKDCWGASAVLPRVDEGQMDAVCALSGSGPAFVYRFMEAMIKAGEAAGLDAEIASVLAKQTVLGSAKLACDSVKSVGELTDEVCSPGGTTIEGVNVLDSSDFNECVSNTILASARRSKELSQ